MDLATQIFEKHWEKRSHQKGLDPITERHMSYAIDAVREALSYNSLVTTKKQSRLSYITYCIYVLFHQGIILCSFSYATFILNASGWWWFLGVFLMAFKVSPESWRKLTN